MTCTPAAGTGERSPRDGDDGGAFTVPLPLSNFNIKARPMLPDGLNVHFIFFTSTYRDEPLLLKATAIKFVVSKQMNVNLNVNVKSKRSMNMSHDRRVEIN